MEGILRDRFNCVDILSGEKEANEPSICNFKNAYEAIELLHRHINSNSMIVIHGDVDVDGIGSTYELNRFMLWMGVLNRVSFLINKEKIHGIGEAHVEYFKRNKIGLLIVLDSSSNELESIKGMDCDVIVIDHHEVNHNELSGDTMGGKYYIVNNVISNKDTSSLKGYIPEIEGYEADENMSCGLVVYELLRIYMRVYKGGSRILEDNLLYQWAGVTLFTDVIKLDTERNQYYIDKTVHSVDTELALSQMLKSVNKYKSTLDKTTINFSIAPRINKAIRAGASREALSIVLNKPYNLKELDKYKEAQERVIKEVCEEGVEGIRGVKVIDRGYRSYSGVIGNKLVGKLGRSIVVCSYNSSSGLYEGSFRGSKGGVDYLGYIQREYPSIYVQGHKGAFGIKGSLRELEGIMEGIDGIEPKGIKRDYITAGEMEDSLKGVHHIDSMEEFKKRRGLLRLAIANSKLSSDEAIEIRVKNRGDYKGEWYGNYGEYEIEGLRCKVFEEIGGSEWISIYVEYTNGIDIYAKRV